VLCYADVATSDATSELCGSCMRDAGSKREQALLSHAISQDDNYLENNQQENKKGFLSVTASQQGAGMTMTRFQNKGRCIGESLDLNEPRINHIRSKKRLKTLSERIPV
jgi:hypothetical protein